MKLRKILLPVAFSVLLIGAGCSLFQTVNVNTSTNVSAANTNVAANTNTAVAAITYQGQDGKNALELLQAGHTVDASDKGFVNAIDGVVPGDHQYWALYVNGTLASVGAKDLQTKSTDSVVWKLDSY